MKTLPYQRVFERIRAEFVEMPGMQLTLEQVERLTGVDSPTCKTVLDDLVRAGFLCITANSSYGRLSGPRRAESAEVQRGTAERRAS